MYGGKPTNEEQFRSELHRHLVDRIERNLLKLAVTTKELCAIRESQARADMVVYDRYHVPEYGFVAVTTPNILRLYRYDGKLGDMAHITPKDVEGGTYIDKKGHRFSWQA